MRNILSAALLGALSALPVGLSAPAASAHELLMFEEKGCIWCARWNEEIAPIYPRTPESRIAPLRRVNLNAPLPRDVRGIPAITYTPTFVLFDDGEEVGRIEGYPGEDFFWGLLDRLLSKIDHEDT